MEGKKISRFSLKQMKYLICEGKAVEKELAELIIRLNSNPVDIGIWGIEKELALNISHVKTAFGESSDISVRDLVIGRLGKKAAVVFIGGLVNKTQLDTQVISPLIKQEADCFENNNESGHVLERLKTELLAINTVKDTSSFVTAVEGILSGQAALFVDGVDAAIMLETKGWEIRSISEPETESAVNAAREGFNETLSISLSQIRRRIKDVNLIIKSIKLGRRSQTEVAIVFIKGIVNPDYVAMAVERLGSIDIDRIIGAGDIEALIEDHPGSPFPQVIKTERPDKTVSALTDGQVAILVDGTPIAMLLPATLPQFFQTVEDYNEHWLVASLIRITRYISAFFSLTLPALYIAVVGYHPGLIPPELAFTIGKALSNIPFPVFFEATFMVFSIEVLQEAGLRLPKPIGPTVGIVGGIVIGDAAVRASLVSPVMVVVIALTAINSYAQPNYSFTLAVRLLRVPIMIAAAVFGLYGFTVAIVLLLGHLCGLKSFGVSYLAPFAPVKWQDVFDTLLKRRDANSSIRPEYLDTSDEVRGNR